MSNSKIVIVDLGSGNLGSIPHALRRVGHTASITDNEGVIAAADRIILPGVGAFDSVVKALDDRQLRSVLARKALEQKTPILGICVGMQMMLSDSEEGILPGFGWISGSVRRFHIPEGDKKIRVPHMGWNTVSASANSRLFAGLNAEPRFYFVHSYYAECRQRSDVAGSTHYGVDFASAIEKNNIMGVQFHPERSHDMGLAVFRNFLAV